MISQLSKRFNALTDQQHCDPFADQLELTAGCFNDYVALARFHYRQGKPAVFSRILAIRHKQQNQNSRYDRFQRNAQTVAVLVETAPVLHCRLRDQALSDRYQHWKNPRERGAILNSEMRCIARVIVHPQWRGIGLATQLVRHALATATTLYTEAIAAMGSVHPFLERAGMTAYHRPPHEKDARLISVFNRLDIAPNELALPSKTIDKVAALHCNQQRWLESELKRWHRLTIRRGHDDLTTPQLLTAAQKRLYCQPVYYLHDNRPTSPCLH